MRKHKSKFLSVTQLEPAAVRGAVVAVLSLLSLLGVSWAADVDKATLGVLVAVVLAVAPLVQAAWTRAAVTANAKVIARVTSEGSVVAGEASETTPGAALPVTVDPGAGLQPVVAVRPALVAQEAG